MSRHRDALGLSTGADYDCQWRATRWRPLAGERYDGLFEFKTPQGGRLFYMYWPGALTILINGCDKTDPPEPNYEIARQCKIDLESIGEEVDLND